MKLFNSLTREIEDFVPLKKGKVGMYTCGPTVYDYDHIGHGWKYVHDDLLRRALAYNGYKVTHVQNITDVGHLVSDGDEGEDKLEKGSRKAGKTAWEVADFFAAAHFESMDKLNILRPDVSCRATQHIPEQITLVKKLLEKDFAYETPEAVYFSVDKFPRYNDLFGNQNVSDKLTAAREDVQTGSHKKNPADFALWFKRLGRFVNHEMHWASPWGEGFPGWHIECSAMSMKYLGDSFDIHTGGSDHIPVHHPNEIAQSESATGRPLAKYWLHYAMVNVDGAKMSKSLNNFYRVEDVEEKGFSPLALRYLFLTAHYRTNMNFTWSSLAAAQTAYQKLKAFVVDGSRLAVDGRKALSKEKAKKIDDFKSRFLNAINSDLNFPQSLAVVWEMLKSNISDFDKRDLLLDWDEVLGLGLANSDIIEQIPDEVKKLAGIREGLRKEGKFVLADEVRVQISEMGWEVLDTGGGSVFKKTKN